VIPKTVLLKPFPQQNPSAEQDMSRKRGDEKKTNVSGKQNEKDYSRPNLWIRCGFFVLLGLVVYIPALRRENPRLRIPVNQP
jgi:hypothetical protein